MSKQKQEELQEKKNKLSYETEIALLGVMVVIISLIGLLNQGILGSLITFCFIYINPN